MPMLTVSPESLSQLLRLGECQSHRRTNPELIKIWATKTGWIKDRSYENSVVNTNVGNQEMLDKDYCENLHEKDSTGPWKQRLRK